MSDVLLDVRGLRTYFDIEGKTAKAVDGVDFTIGKGEVVGLVGESGSGKSVTALSILKLIPSPPGRIEAGEILYKGKDLLQLSYKEMQSYRGREISMIFQEPMTALNPVFTIGRQVSEGIRHHLRVSKDEATARAVEMLKLVGIPDPAKRLKASPHQFSGGQRQRVMIAMALALEPALLLADEPTTALDVTIQAQILELMLKIKSKTGDAAILLITHDLAVVAETCQKVVVMYGGRVQEIAPAKDLFVRPSHPYTRGLLGSLPRPDQHAKGTRLTAIPGMVPSILDFPRGCKFCNRCPDVQDICAEVEPALVELAPGHQVRCHLYPQPPAAVAASAAPARPGTSS